MKDPGQNSMDRKGRSRIGQQKTEQAGQEKQDRDRIIVG
jgi:hypothetical protein